MTTHVAFLIYSAFLIPWTVPAETAVAESAVASHLATAEDAPARVDDRFMLAAQKPVSWLRDSAFRYKLPDLEGNIISYDDTRFDGKVVLYDVWGTWCPPCREMTPFLKRLHETYQDKGLVVVGIAFEYEQQDVGDPLQLVKDYVAENTIEYLQLYAGAAEYPSSLVFTELSFRKFDGFPTVVLVDRQGKTRRLELGFESGVAEQLEQFVKDLLAEE